MENSIDFKEILHRIPVGYALHKVFTNEKGKVVDYIILDVNKAFERIMGVRACDVIGKNRTELLNGKDDSMFDWINFYGEVALTGGEKEIQHYSSLWQKWFDIKVFSPEKYFFITFFTDADKLVNEKEFFKRLLCSLNDGIIALDVYKKILYTNMAAGTFSVILPKDAFGKDISDFFRFEQIKEKEVFLSFIDKAYEKKESFYAEFTTDVLSANNRSFSLNFGISSISDPLGKFIGLNIIIKDVTQHLKYQDDLLYASFHDSLTGLYNRTFFNEKIDQIDTAQNLPLSLIIGDINGLKLANDAFGHLEGDRLIVNAARAIQKGCRKTDIIVRWGGDEFIVLLAQTPLSSLDPIVSRIKEECLTQEKGKIELSISLGYATKTEESKSMDELLKSAEEVMYTSKILESRSIKSKTMNLIITTLHERSPMDSQHSLNVSKLCKIFSKKLGLTEKDCSTLEILGNIHDIGKITISDSILNKKSSLDESEWKEVRKHSEAGYHILSSTHDLAFLADCVLFHHERYDGKGYPKGIKEKEIPFFSRVLSICDAYDSMVSGRPYKKSMTKKQIIKEFADCSGKQFDPELCIFFIEKVIENL
ncbi:MAG TPA: diguanylate cyclase [Petrotogaceae bacterium]|mgnify:FL=1|nr:diguanylate cyclase [Petrotogaceae bacterium]